LWHRNAPLDRASFRIAQMAALDSKQIAEAEDVIGSALQIASDELLQKGGRILRS